MDRQTDSFEINAEDGTRHRVYESVEILDAATMGDPGATTEGLKRLKTSDGYHVNKISENGFEIVELNLKATRV